ncbi:MAG: integrase [Ruminococcus flavefaciens]|nr:integrase [Ruminococcus flavefaciens]
MSIYRWIKRYNGKWWSLKERSHRPKHHPAEQTEEEYNLIKRYYPYYDDMIMLWDRLREKGYKRCYQTMLRAIRRMKFDKSPCARRARKPNPYQRADYLVQKVQIDVKFVPSYCVANGKKYYQYTAIDERTRFCYREMYDEHSTYSSKDFLMKLIKAFPFPIREIQTDDETEWTTQLLVKNPESKTMFEKALEDMDIIYHRIRVAPPRHNGKVERQHKIDKKRFYSKMRMYSLENGRKQLARYNKKSNNISKSCLKYRSPNAVPADYMAVMW